MPIILASLPLFRILALPASLIEGLIRRSHERVNRLVGILQYIVVAVRIVEGRRIEFIVVEEIVFCLIFYFICKHFSG